MTMTDDSRRSELVEKLAEAVARRGLRTPAIWLLEMHKPLGFLGAQALLFFQPLLGVMAGDDVVRDYAALLEDPTGVEHLLERLEQVETGVRSGR